MSDSPAPQIQIWHIDKFVFMRAIPARTNWRSIACRSVDAMSSDSNADVLARSDGSVVDGHLRLKGARKAESWPGGDITAIPVLLCDEWSEAQVRAFRIPE